jgi:hypothetical protein
MSPKSDIVLGHETHCAPTAIRIAAYDHINEMYNAGVRVHLHDGGPHFLHLCFASLHREQDHHRLVELATSASLRREEGTYLNVITHQGNETSSALQQQQQQQQQQEECLAPFGHTSALPPYAGSGTTITSSSLPPLLPLRKGGGHLPSRHHTTILRSCTAATFSECATTSEEALTLIPSYSSGNYGGGY